MATGNPIAQRLGNQSLQQVLRARLLRAELAEEQEALQRRVSTDPLALQRQLPEEEEDTLARAETSEKDAPVVDAETERSIHLLAGRGTALPEAARSYMEPRFKADFSAVRIHNDAQAHALSRSVKAQAFTVGRDIVFGAGHYRPETQRGRHLLAHELTHVLQQGAAAPVLRRQVVPQELRSSADVARLSDSALAQRYDLITKTLSTFNESNADSVALEQEAARIGDELARRSALAAGRTFDPVRVEAMRQYFIRNAKSANPDSCIDTLNRGVRTVLNQPQQRMGGEIQTTMARLQTSGRAGTAEVIECNDSAGRLTTGTREPQSLNRSVWSTLLQLNGRDVGWSVFGLSLVDGYHSITLTLDNNDPDRPRVYWSDQWSNRGGWQEFTSTGLDAEVLRLTLDFRRRFNADHGGRAWPRTRATLWRLHQ